MIAKRLHGRELTSARISPAQFMRTLEIKRALRLPVILNQPDGKVAGIQEAEARAVERRNLKAARLAVEIAKPRKAPRNP